MSKFSDIKIFPVSGNKSLVARGSVVMGDMVRVNFTVMNGPSGQFVSLPAEKSEKKDEKGKTIYYPHAKMISKELNEELNKTILAQLAKGGTATKTEGIPF